MTFIGIRNIIVSFNVHSGTKDTQNNRVYAMTISEIRKYLIKGDMTEVAELTGYSPQTVRKMLSGQRKANEKVVAVAKQIAFNRKQVRAQALADLVNGN